MTVLFTINRELLLTLTDIYHFSSLARNKFFLHSSFLVGEQDSHRTSIDDQNKGFYELKKKKDKLQGERNDLCRKEMNLQQSLSSLKEELSKVRR